FRLCSGNRPRGARRSARYAARRRSDPERLSRHVTTPTPGRIPMSRKRTWQSLLSGAAVVIGATALLAAVAPAQQASEVKVALIAPLSGPWARQGDLVKKRAEMAIED